MPELACSADRSNCAVATELHVLVAEAAHTLAKVLKRRSPCHLKFLAERWNGKDSCLFYSDSGIKHLPCPPLHLDPTSAVHKSSEALSLKEAPRTSSTQAVRLAGARHSQACSGRPCQGAPIPARDSYGQAGPWQLTPSSPRAGHEGSPGDSEGHGHEDPRPPGSPRAAVAQNLCQRRGGCAFGRSQVQAVSCAVWSQWQGDLHT